VKNHKNTASVSVVIPCYRCADTIRRAVESVAQQTLIPYEVILVEDGSGDNTLESLYKLQSEYGDSWLKVIPLSENGGPGAARNTGWDTSKQAYIAFLDADDSWHPQKIEIQYQWMVKNPDVALTGHDFLYQQPNHQALEIEKYSSKSVSFYRVDRLISLLYNKFPTPSVMLKRAVPLRFVTYKKYCEDYHLWTEFTCSSYNCFRVNIPLVFLHKPAYGHAGLSSQLWEMERGELDVYKNLYKKRHINLFLYVFLLTYSYVKFLKRVVS